MSFFVYGNYCETQGLNFNFSKATNYQPLES